MEKVACVVRFFLMKNCHDLRIDLSHEFNSLIAISYWNNKQIRPHRDQLFDKSGNFRKIPTQGFILDSSFW